MKWATPGRGALTTLAGAVLLVSPATLAVTDGKILSGNACVAEDGAQQGDLYYVGGTARDDVASMRHMVCPIVRDLTGVGTLSADLRLYRAPYATVSCFVYCCPNNGGACDSDYGTGTAGAGGGYTTMSLGPVDTASNGYCFVDCEADPGSGVAFYEWQEQE